MKKHIHQTRLFASLAGATPVSFLHSFCRLMPGIRHRCDGLPGQSPRALRAIAAAFVGLLLLMSQPVRAVQLVLQMDIHQAGSAAGGNLSYYAFSFLSTTNTPITYHQVYSWNTNYQFVGGVGPGSSTWGLGFGTLADMLNAFTNGPWKLVMNVGDPSEKTYYFSMSAPHFTTNTFPAVHVLSPTNGAVNVTNNPVFTWTTTTNYAELDVNVSGSYQNFYNATTLTPTATNWNPGQILNQGVFSFDVNYLNSNAPGVLLITTPTNSLGQTPPGWTTTNRLFADDSSQFTVGAPDPSGTDHTLVAHYTWNGTNNDGTASGADTSGNGYDMNFGGGYGAQGGVNGTNDAAAGSGAIRFHDGDGGSAGFAGWNPTPQGLLTALSGSFSISCWIKTTQSGFSWDNGPAWYGAGIVSADNSGQANDTIPIALTGNKIGFNTGGDLEDDTVNSATSVNDGNYHHVVVTRNQRIGQKIIYIDGVLDSFSTGTTNLLSDPRLLTIGALSDASNPDASTANYSNGYDGLLDDLQIYSGVLSSNEVAQLYSSPGSTVGPVISAPLVARYDFELTNAPGTDSSGNGNDANCGTGTGSTTNNDTFSTDAAVGSYARAYFGNNAICFYPNGAACFNNISNALYGSFSLSAWVNTTNSVNADYANAYYGSPIFFDYNSYTNSAIFSITGSKAAFTVGNPNGTDTTLHSATSVNDGHYHLIVTTRNASSGVMKVYVDGNLDGTATSTVAPVIPTATMYLAGGYDGFYFGLLDDFRVYGGELSAADVAALAGHPAADFNAALNTTGLTWTTSGDTSWFVQTTNTHDGVSAAQSGSVINNQSSTLSVTVTGPGTLTFYWASQDSCNNFNYEFDMDGSYQDNIQCSTSWYQDGPFNIPSGQHTLTWTTHAYGDTDPTEAGFLDQVSYVPTPPVTNIAPVITLNPFNQTNYPGYSVALLADASGIPDPAWQWFKVGSGLISSATNKLYIPANAGSAGVAGSYYAVASNLVGTANSATATVSFASATLPPDWSRAFKSPSFNNNTLTEEYYLATLPDSLGNLYTVGSFSGTNTIGAQTFVAANGTYLTEIVKQSSTGTAIWALAMTNNGTGTSEANCIAPAPGGGIYVAGYFSGTNWIGTNMLVDASTGPYATSIFLARFDANGNNLWVRTISGTNYCFMEYYSLVADPAGNASLSGLIWGSTTFNSTNAATSTNLVASGQQGALAQYDANGALRWAQITPNWIVNMTYNNGRIYGSVGNGATNFSFGNINFVTDRAKTIFALNATNGQPIWLQGIGAPFGQDNPLGISVDFPLVAVSGSNVIIIGTSPGTNAAFGPYSASWPGFGRQYFARCDTNGTPQLLTAFGSPTTLPWSILAAADGDVYLSGDFDTYSFFGNDMIAAPRLDTIGTGYFSAGFLAKFDRNGNPLWARPATSQSNLVNLRGLALAADGIWACGVIKSPTAFGTNVVASAITCIGSPFCTLAHHYSGALAKITDGAAGPLPVTLLNPQNSGAAFQFQFLSQAGFNHSILYRTNLAVGNWQTNSTIAGDGTLKTISVPLSVFSPAKQGFIRVSTH